MSIIKIDMAKAKELHKNKIRSARASKLAEQDVRNIENDPLIFKKFEPLLKLYDRANVINKIESYD